MRILQEGDELVKLVVGRCKVKTQLKYPLSTSQLAAVRRFADERDAKLAAKMTTEGRDVAAKGTTLDRARHAHQPPLPTII
jgi:hypothetical protein